MVNPDIKTFLDQFLFEILNVFLSSWL